ncbi:hypothetical protein V2J09_014001 [Rumex salicifolius]
MAMAQQQQDVVVTRDSQDNIIVDRYAKALHIADSNGCWEYERVIKPIERAIVHYAKLLGSVRVEVQGAQPVEALTPNINYNVYVDLKLEDDAVGFNDPVVFVFTDQQTVKKTTVKLQKGDNMVCVGQFVSSIGIFRNVSVGLTTNPCSTETKKGLVVRRMSFTTA